MLKILKHDEPRDTLRLTMVEDQYGVHIVAVDENGDPLPRGYIASFAQGDGRLILHKGTNPDLGLDLDDQGVIKTMVR